MKNSESNHTKTPQYSAAVSVMKSQKILNSLSNFNLKTQSDKQQQQHRSPQNNRNEKVELRETWRRPRMPYNKLPQAFNQQKSRKNKNNQEVISNINKIVEHNSSKKATQYLEPIKFENKKQQQNKKKLGQNRNPLIPFLKYRELQKRINQQFKEVNDFSIDKLKNQFKFNTINPMKVNECITLQVIKRGHHTGTIKKMLHVPTLKVICVREQPLNSKQSRMAIRDWISIWQTKLQPIELNSSFLHIYNQQFNYPQGAVSILTEYLKGGSLLNLLQFVRTLPQSVIRQIISQVIKILNQFYQLTGMNFGGLSPSQIMFTLDGKIKMGLGLYYHFTNINSNNIYFLKSNNKANIFDFNATQYKFMKNSIERPLNLDLQISYDIFKLGLILLECSIGSLQNFQQTNLIYDAVKYFFSEQGQKQAQRNNICCIIHSENILIDIASQLQESDRTKRQKTDPVKTIQYIRFLKDRYSNQLVNFLCNCLKISHTKRPSFGELMSHNFITSFKDPDNQTVKVDLKDLLTINGGYLQDNILQSRSQQKVEKFLSHILHVFSGCKKDTIVDLINNQKDKILNISKDIDMNYLNLGPKLYQALQEMAKIDR